MINSKIYYKKGIIKNWTSGMLTQTQLSQIQFYAIIEQVKTFHQILRALSFAEAAVFQIGAHGMKIIAEEARTVQASAYIKRNNQSFLDYKFKEEEDGEEFVSFSVNLNVVVQNLNMFSEEHTQLKLLYKNYGSPLIMILESVDENLTVECAIKTRDITPLLDLEIDDNNTLVHITFKGFDYFNLMSDSFKTSPGAEEVELDISSRCFTTKLYGAVESLYKFDKNSDAILYYDCKQQVNFKYRTSNLKLMLKSLQLATTTTISIDKRGMLGVRVANEDDKKIQSYIEYFIVPLNDKEE